MYTDTHCHLDSLDGPPGDAVDRANAAGVTTLVTVGTDLASSAESVQLASALTSVRAVVGIHPHNAIEATEQVMRRLSSLALHPRVAGIGETGLDYFREHSPQVRQQEAFREHIRMAKDHDKALVIHDREAHDDVVGILDDEQAPERTVFHCFSGGTELVGECARRGWYMSFAGNVTFRNAPDLREAVLEVPLELLLTETDSPYLSPHPFRGKPNEPARVTLVVDELAELRGLTSWELGRLTAENAQRAFGL